MSAIKDYPLSDSLRVEDLFFVVGGILLRIISQIYHAKQKHRGRFKLKVFLKQNFSIWVVSIIGAFTVVFVLVESLVFFTRELHDPNFEWHSGLSGLISLFSVEILQVINRYRKTLFDHATNKLDDFFGVDSGELSNDAKASEKEDFAQQDTKRKFE